MEEKRKHPRTEVNETAYVSSGGSVMSCMVRNISAEGAAIDIENPAFVPPRFRLVMANGSAVRECQVAWIQRNRIGLTFVEPSPASCRPNRARAPPGSPGRGRLFDPQLRIMHHLGPLFDFQPDARPELLRCIAHTLEAEHGEALVDVRPRHAFGDLAG